MQQLISRNIAHSDLKPTDKSFLLDTLRIPKSWVDRALALRAHINRDFEAEMNLLFSVGDYPSAHSIFMHRVANSLFAASCNTERNTDTCAKESAQRAREKLLNILVSMSEHDARIEEWDQGGKVYFEYLQLSGLSFLAPRDPLQESKEPLPEVHTLAQIESRLHELVRKLNANWTPKLQKREEWLRRKQVWRLDLSTQWACVNDEEGLVLLDRFCLTELSTGTYNMLAALRSKKDGALVSKCEDGTVLLQVMRDLPLSPEEAYPHIQELTRLYSQLVSS